MRLNSKQSDNFIEFNKDRSNAVFILYICRVNWKWYIPLLVVILAFASAGMKQSTTGPNQEIVVWFYADSVNDTAAQDVISDISYQLELLGAKDVRISKMSDGSLKILYYSSLDVAVVKKVLHENNGLPTSDQTYPKGENPLNFPFDGSYGFYNIDVVKIQEDANQQNSFQGVMVEVTWHVDNSLKPKNTPNAALWIFDYESAFEQTNYSLFIKDFEWIGNSSYLIPEVRAGPIA